MRGAVFGFAPICALIAGALGACSSVGSVLRPVEPFSEAALYADDKAYVALRYQPETMVFDLRNELVAIGYACSPRAAGGFVCSRATPAGPGCEDVGIVEIRVGDVDAVRTRRCAGLIAPP